MADHQRLRRRLAQRGRPGCNPCRAGLLGGAAVRHARTGGGWPPRNSVGKPAAGRRPCPGGGKVCGGYRPRFAHRADRPGPRGIIPPSCARASGAAPRCSARAVRPCRRRRESQEKLHKLRTSRTRIHPGRGHPRRHRARDGVDRGPVPRREPWQTPDPDRSRKGVMRRTPRRPVATPMQGCTPIAACTARPCFLAAHVSWYLLSLRSSEQ